MGKATGVDLDALVRVMGAGSGGSAMLGLKAGPMREHDYTTLFKLEHMLKDVRLCLEEGQAAGVPFPPPRTLARCSPQAWDAVSVLRISPRWWRFSRASPASAFEPQNPTVHRKLYTGWQFWGQRMRKFPLRSRSRPYCQ